MKKVYIRYKEDLPESEMMFVAQEGFRQRGVHTVPFYGFGDVEKINDFGPDVGLVGYIGDVWKALATLGIPKPVPFDYPDDLKWFLGRDVRKERLKDVRDGRIANVFVKPVNHKMFTGFVSHGAMRDAQRLSHYDDDEPVWVSDIIEPVSEYRVFVLNKCVVDARLYKGEWFKSLDFVTVTSAVMCWEDQPAAWTLDVGLDRNGRHYLIEVNDGYSFGGYGLRPTDYAKMIEARWRQLVNDEK